MFCPQCGTSNPDTSSYCKKCGASLQQAAVTAQTLANMTPKTPSASFNKPFVVGISIALALGLGVSAYALATGRAGIGILGTPTSASVTDVDPGLAMVAKNFVGALYGRDIASMTPRELLEDAVIAEQCLPYLKPSPVVYDKFVESVIEDFGSDPTGTMRVMTDEPTMEMIDENTLKVSVPYKLEEAPPVSEYVSGTETNPTEQLEGPADRPAEVGDAQVPRFNDDEIQANIEKALEDLEKTEVSEASPAHTSEPKTTSEKTPTTESEVSKEDKQPDAKPEESANVGTAEQSSSGNQGENTASAAESSDATETPNPLGEMVGQITGSQSTTGEDSDEEGTTVPVDTEPGNGETQPIPGGETSGDGSDNSESSPQATGDDTSDPGTPTPDTPTESVAGFTVTDLNGQGYGVTTGNEYGTTGGQAETQSESQESGSASDGASRILFARKERNAIFAFLR